MALEARRAADEQGGEPEVLNGSERAQPAELVGAGTAGSSSTTSKGQEVTGGAAAPAPIGTAVTGSAAAGSWVARVRSWFTKAT